MFKMNYTKLIEQAIVASVHAGKEILKVYEGEIIVEMKECITTHIPTLLNFSDIVTKVLYGQKHKNLVNRILYDLYEYE